MLMVVLRLDLFIIFQISRIFYGFGQEVLLPLPPSPGSPPTRPAGRRPPGAAKGRRGGRKKRRKEVK